MLYKGLYTIQSVKRRPWVFRAISLIFDAVVILGLIYFGIRFIFYVVFGE